MHYALGYVGNGVALSNYCGSLLANRLTGKTENDAVLLAQPLLRFRLIFRRLYQRAVYRLCMNSRRASGRPREMNQ